MSNAFDGTHVSITSAYRNMNTIAQSRFLNLRDLVFGLPYVLCLNASASRWGLLLLLSLIFCFHVEYLLTRYVHKPGILTFQVSIYPLYSAYLRAS